MIDWSASNSAQPYKSYSFYLIKIGHLVPTQPGNEIWTRLMFLYWANMVWLFSPLNLVEPRFPFNAPFVFRTNTPPP